MRKRHRQHAQHCQTASWPAVKQQNSWRAARQHLSRLFTQKFIYSDLLPTTFGYKPMFPYALLRQLRVMPHLQGTHLAALQAGFPELERFSVLADFHAWYDNHITLRLYTGHERRGDSGGGTLAPLTPVLPDGSVLAFTNDHCVSNRASRHPKPFLTCTPSVISAWHAVAEENRLPVEVVKFGTLPETVHNVSKSLRRPSSPEGHLPHTWDNADMALTRVKDWPQCRQPPLEKFFIPCADTLPSGHPVVVISTGGNVSIEWACRHLAHTGHPNELDWKTPRDRLDILKNNAFWPDCTTTAPGTVHNANDEVVEHTASVLPGCSGAAGVDMEQPRKLLFLYTQSQTRPKRPWSYGVSVQHLVAGYMYIKGVLPSMQLVGSDDPALPPDGLQGILQYANSFEKHWDDWEVRGIVDAFKGAHSCLN
ncbi:hypothetical protein WJX72_004344 [[Myrmecia] bisecta]|uniref:Uncharacterized protein n=1 Tax=[Myrmecia] bisecta TaxID=41462 RepID=A0AAW1R5V7_9CHLO